MNVKNRWIPISISGSALIFAMSPFASKAFQNTPAAAQPAKAAPNPQQAAAQQATKEDRQQMMSQLHIAALRPGVNARVLGETNYDEAKANPYPDLPDPL